MLHNNNMPHNRKILIQIGISKLYVELEVIFNLTNLMHLISKELNQMNSGLVTESTTGRSLTEVLIVSKLLFNVHIWSRFHGAERNALNAVYMRLWRRIVGEARYTATARTDEQIRSAAGVPSID